MDIKIKAASRTHEFLLIDINFINLTILQILKHNKKASRPCGKNLKNPAHSKGLIHCPFVKDSACGVHAIILYLIIWPHGTYPLCTVSRFGRSISLGLRLVLKAYLTYHAVDPEKPGCSLGLSIQNHPMTKITFSPKIT
jgi:hypothetical protein